MVTLHVQEDVGDEKFCDLLEFPPLDPDDEFGQDLVITDDEHIALEGSPVVRSRLVKPSWRESPWVESPTHRARQRPLTRCNGQGPSYCEVPARHPYPPQFPGGSGMDGARPSARDRWLSSPGRT
ncbi:hypothetical protein GCM10010365_50680 [Streptomyces poonensis]|uniref:Uncharacterized protein n=1 Tax=Streptomyces poonensis TaxID=68255 RepID=A0A918PWJ3_9ACTN|nr:hypothetical protein GCM10010365_50680 [Streptomyces poonensis]GLJ89953.1 hypothetical protein GCM10017589_25540 [Streptomyces poonensis]